MKVHVTISMVAHVIWDSLDPCRQVVVTHTGLRVNMKQKLRHRVILPVTMGKIWF